MNTLERVRQAMKKQRFFHSIPPEYPTVPYYPVDPADIQLLLALYEATKGRGIHDAEPYFRGVRAAVAALESEEEA